MFSPEPVVRLENAFREPFNNAVATARTCYSPRVVTSAEVDENEESRAQRDRIAHAAFVAGHHTILQHAAFQFVLERVSRHFLWSFLHSHPFYNSEQVSQRYVEVKPGHFAIPPLGQTERARFEATCALQMRAYQELVEILRAAPPDAFIEKTELLGSRRVLGDPAMDQILTEEVVRPFVFEDVRYPLDLVAELRARRQAGAAEEMEIKETPGGLRDVAILLAILKARLQLRWPDGPALYARLRLEMPALSEVIEDLEKTATFLRRLRAVYRLTVGSEDRLAPSYFGILALFMGYGHYPGGGAAELLGDYRAALGRVRLRLRECLGALGLPTEGI